MENPTTSDAMTLCQAMDMEVEDLFDMMYGDWSSNDDSDGTSTSVEYTDDSHSGGLTALRKIIEWLMRVPLL